MPRCIDNHHLSLWELITDILSDLLLGNQVFAGLDNKHSRRNLGKVGSIVRCEGDAREGFRVRTHYSHQMTAAARAIAPMKLLRLRSKRVAMRRQSLKRQNMRSTTLRCL